MNLLVYTRTMRLRFLSQTSQPKLKSCFCCIFFFLPSTKLLMLWPSIPSVVLELKQHQAPPCSLELSWALYPTGCGFIFACQFFASYSLPSPHWRQSREGIWLERERLILLGSGCPHSWGPQPNTSQLLPPNLLPLVGGGGNCG